ncbi:glycosyltransferase [Undibacterium sp. TS12]|uniref:glycosyltransferase n=1 Tax=Undibacterium sp. TS12 TaxID=2908202 RepID=UPI001F4CE0F2|nr:glycosyltransferase [Undibacterium sp. TS12]
MYKKFLEKVYRPLWRWLLNDVDKLVIANPECLPANSIQSHRGRVGATAYGVDVGRYPEARDELIVKWQQRFDRRFYLFVGGLLYRRGLHTLLEALTGTDMMLVIVGQGPEEQALKQQALELGLDNVHFLGSLPEEDKLALLSLCYGLVFPANKRKDGVSFLEAAIFGRPVIYCESDTGGRYLDIAVEAGLVVVPEDVLALRGAMARLWNYPCLALQMGKLAQRRVQTLFAADMMAKNYVRLYVDVISGNAMTP